MAQTVIPGAQDAGLAAFQSQNFGLAAELFSGDTPVNTLPENVGASANLPAFSVVGRTGNAPGGNLVLATQDGTVQAIGITTVNVVTGAGVATTVDVFRSGMFNPDALNWHASFTTEAQKKAAFDAAPAGTNIHILKPKFSQADPI